MKKIIALIISVLIISMIGNAVAECDVNINTESILELNGRGTIDRDLLAQTEYGYNGQRLTDTMYSRWMSTDSLSNISFKSDLSMYIGPSETHENTNISEIRYAQTTFTTNVNQKVCSKNYDAGVVTGFKITGNSGKAFEIMMVPDSNYLELEGALEGKAILKHMVIDPTTGLKIVREKTRIEGKYLIDWEAFSNKPMYKDVTHESDWLGCP